MLGVPGQCKSVALKLGYKMDFSFVPIRTAFTETVTYMYTHQACIYVCTYLHMKFSVSLNFNIKAMPLKCSYYIDRSIRKQMNLLNIFYQ